MVVVRGGGGRETEQCCSVHKVMESGSLVLTGVLLGSVLWHCTAGVYLTGEAASVDHILTTRTGACVCVRVRDHTFKTSAAGVKLGITI